MLLKTIAGMSLFALVGGAIGYSQILCADGGCAITGTSYGGAFFGGMIGLAVMSGVNNRADLSSPPADDQDDDSKD